MQNDDETPCPECGGRGVEFRGHGLNSEFKFCSAYLKSETPPGHPTWGEVVKINRERRRQLKPNGRFA